MLWAGRYQSDFMSQIPEIPWIEAADTPWGIRVLDVRAVTQAMIATSADPQCAANAVSFDHDDGSAFEQAEPLVQRVIGAMIPYRVEGVLTDGALFRPRVMEHKWAIFHRQSGHRQSGHCQGRIFFVRSWTRKVHVIAELASREDSAQVTSLNGVFTDEDESPLFTTMAADFLLRSHALGMVYPAPLPEDMEASQQAALWCFQMFGNLALCATHEIIPVHMPEQALSVLL
jgi:hypothetical protein